MNAAVVLALLPVSLVLWSVEAEAAQARIEGFEFSCTAPDGQTLKPANGDIEGSVYTDLPVQRAQCRKAIKFKIGLCLDNTGFGSSDQGREFPGCLPVFEAQSQDCVRHFLRERAKCDAGSDSTAEAEDDPPAAPEDQQAGAADETPYTVDPLDKVMVATKRAHVFAGPGSEHAVLYTLEVGAGGSRTGLTVAGRDEGPDAGGSGETGARPADEPRGSGGGAQADLRGAFADPVGLVGVGIRSGTGGWGVR